MLPKNLKTLIAVEKLKTLTASENFNCCWKNKSAAEILEILISSEKIRNINCF